MCEWDGTGGHDKPANVKARKAAHRERAEEERRCRQCCSPKARRRPKAGSKYCKFCTAASAERTEVRRAAERKKKSEKNKHRKTVNEPIARQRKPQKPSKRGTA